MAKQEEEAAGFIFPIQLPPLDYSVFSSLDCFHHYDLLATTQDNVLDAMPLVESFPTDPLYSSLDLVRIPTPIREDSSFGYGNGLGVWNQELSGSTTGFEPQNQPLLFSNNDGETDHHVEQCVEDKEVTNNKRCREEKIGDGSKALSRNTISQYFYMPITQAAKELNVGVTLLKRRCRELGIRRWPHRKLMSLQTLIKNVTEMGKGGGEGAADGSTRVAIEILEQERKLVEEAPDVPLEDKTKRLRQACFKASYKKRKLMGMNFMDHSTYSSNSSSGHNPPSMDVGIMDDEERDKMKSLLSACFSSSDMIF